MVFTVKLHTFAENYRFQCYPMCAIPTDMEQFHMTHHAITHTPSQNYGFYEMQNKMTINCHILTVKSLT
jgi:hypothetical protein